MRIHKNIVCTAQWSLLSWLLVVAIGSLTSHQQQQSSLPLQPLPQQQEQEQEQTSASNELGNGHGRQQPSGNQDDSKLQFEMRILALFTGSDNDLGLDHRLGRQVLKLAADRARRSVSGLTNVELIVHNDDTDCSDSSNAGQLPLAVAQNFYLSRRRVGSNEMATSWTNESSAQQPNSDLEQELQEDAADNCQANGQSLDQCSTGHGTELAGAVTGQIDAILGPSCDHQIDQVARMAAYWRTPIYVIIPTSGSLTHKDTYSTLTRLAPSIEHLSSFLVAVMEHFKWRHLAVLVDLNKRENAILVKTLDKTIDQLRYTIPIEHKVFPIETSSLQNLTKNTQHAPDGAKTATTTSCSQSTAEALDGARKVARVVLLLLDDPKLVRQILLCAHELRFNNGEFAFLTLDLGFKSATQNERGAATRRTMLTAAGGGRQSAQVFDWFVQTDEENNLKARQMFESLMVFSVELPLEDEFNSFADQVLEMARQQDEKRPSGGGGGQFESVGAAAVALHDSLLMAVEAKRRFLTANSNGSRGGDETARVLWNQSFSSGLMNTQINANGDQELDYVLSDMEPELGIMRPVASYSKDKMGRGQLKLLANSYVHWPARATAAQALEAAAAGDQSQSAAPLARSEEEPPPDEPECGFTGEAEHCVDRRNMYTALTIVSLFLVAILAILLISLSRYKKIKYQMQLDDYWWRINWSELEFIDLHTSSLHSKLGSNSVIMLKRELDGSVISSGHHSLASVTLPQPVAPPGGDALNAHAPSNKPLSFIGEGLLKSIKRQNAEPAARVSLVVTPAACGPADDSKLEEEEKSLELAKAADKLDRLSLASGNSKTHRDKPACSFRSDLSTVVRSSSLALHKGHVVIVKQLNGRSIEITRSLLVELKCIRELAHENLARLVGLCTERDHLASVYEYCSRGNLQDLLLNSEFHMNRDLKHSIIGDLLNGLNFIHTTLLDCHGRLKSTNLVIDSRFTVKLTDFGLRSLYSQLELIERDDQSDDYSDTQTNRTTKRGGGGSGCESGARALGDDCDRAMGLQCDDLDSKLRRQSAVPTIYNMDSVSMRAENFTIQTAATGHNALQRNASEQTAGGGSSCKMEMKNQSSARFFWTAPEHLRQRQPHLAASAKGDVYSLAIILSEILTRKEPYHFGTNAKPRWSVIRQEKMRHRQAKPDQQVPSIGFEGSSAERLAARGPRRTSSLLKTQSATSSPAKSQPQQKTTSFFQRRKGRNQVAAAASRPLTPPSRKSSLGRESCCSEASNRSATSVLEAPSRAPASECNAGKSVETSSTEPAAQATKQETDSRKTLAGPGGGGAKARSSFSSARLSSHSPKPRLRSGRSQESQAELPVVLDAEPQDEELLDETRHRNDCARLDADEVLDQLRMGVQPEPVRPYIPNFLLADIEPKLIDLLRTCWHENPSQRPTVSQVRSSMRKITKGATARNYLDNLLDCLQTYANQLERIVDFRSADIVAEKMRTEELLYQLVPRFVADKLKQNEPIIPQLYEGVTIFFSDIVGFEKYASVMSPCEMVDLLNNINSSFEDIISSFDVTKIEVILDQFLVAAGISFRQQQQQAATTSQQQQEAGGGGESELSQQQVELADQQRQMAPGEPNSQGTKSRRGLLKSLRKTEGKMFKSSSLEGARGKQSKQSSLSDSQDRKLETSLAQDSVDLYKRSGAEQIARMALCIRDLVKSFHFRQNLDSLNAPQTSAATDSTDCAQAEVGAATQRPTRQTSGGNFVATSFNIRIGIHSGKVCAGIVGLKRPKFCLIGDAVNVASRMHTNSKANKIQISPDTRDLLKQVSGFNIIPRGQIEVKGKGLMETFWLESSQ